MRMVQALTAAPLLLVLAAVAAACGEDSATESAEQPPSERLADAAARMSELTSVEFTLTHEEGHTPLFAGIELQQAEGSVHLPDRASVQVEARVSAINAFIEMEIRVDGDDAAMTDPLSGVLLPVAASELPFNLHDLGDTLGGILLALQEPAYTDTHALDGVASRGIAGSVGGAAIQPLIRGADAALTPRIEVWVGSDSLVRRVRIEGSVLTNDPSPVVRILTFTAFDQAQPLE